MIARVWTFIRWILYMLILASLSYNLYTIYMPHTCRVPVEYDLGNIDERFGLSRSNILSILDGSENVWETYTNTELFKYKSGADFKINFIFDERQQITVDRSNLEEELNKTESSIEKISDTFNKLSDSYDNKLSDFNILQETYNDRVSTYNKKVKKYNDEGEAPPNIFAELEKEKAILESLSKKLERDFRELDTLKDNLNKLVENNNTLIRSHNSNIETYNGRFGIERSFDQGNYTGEDINIFQFDSIETLRLVLAHEFGHVLGIEHVDNSKSIMYYLMRDQNLNNLNLSEEDLFTFREVCKL